MVERAKKKSTSDTKKGSKTSNSVEDGETTTEGESGTDRKQIRKANSKDKTSPKKKNNRQKKSKGTKPKGMETLGMEIVKNVQKVGWAGIEREFTSIRSTIQKDVLTYAHFLKNPNKNRYMDVVCLDNTRYSLITNVPPLSDYVHANRVKLDGAERDYIATQAPMSSTVEDFWRLVYDANSTHVISLQELEMISGKKGESIFPLKVDSTFTFGCMLVTTKTIINSPGEAETTGFICVQVEVRPDDSNTSVMCKVVQTSEWPDDGIHVRERRIAINVMRSVETGEKGTVIIHCSAGIGRTATYIMLTTVLWRLRKGKPINIPSMLMELRQQRASSIQTSEQYANVYLLLIEYLMCKYESIFGKIGTQLMNSYAEYKKSKNDDGGGG